MRALAATALLLATIATPAFAQESTDTTDFSGFHIVAIGGYDRVDDGVTKKGGAVYGGSAGYDISTGSVVVGGEIEATMATTEFCAGAVCVEAGRDLYAGGRVGVPVGGRTLVYVKGGYTNARVDGTFNGATVTTEDLDGVRGGVGLETDISNHIMFRLEYRYSNYEQDVQRHQGVVALGFRF